MPKLPAKDIKPQRNPKDGLTHTEAFREVYHEGFRHALDAVLEGMKGIRFGELGCQVTPEMVVEKVRATQAATLASVAIAKASSA